MKRQYGVREGYSIPIKLAPVIGQTIERLEKGLGRPPTAHDLVEAAGDPGHPLHSRFEWDDARAAYEYRLEQARYMIRAITVQLPERGDMVVRAIIPADDGFTMTAGALTKRPDLIRDHLRRLHESAEQVEREFGAWEALIVSEPAREYVKAARKFAREPHPAHS